ncbi:MAG: beta-hydroxyacyl-ACP dehydratase [Planctomycetes bacterium B3_Pla]|nr:MAG: beta-hydroxyacyl-ACP dehydratase [Planctomycetes bacterium B3_Pla]
MRWIWIDKFVEFHSGERAVALKNVTLAEEHLHDHFPGFPVMPESLMIEGMAQTAGILVGEAKKFQEKVILAKIKKAVFFDYVKPGDTIKLDAKIESIVAEAATTSGRITRDDKVVAEIDLMFSHIDQNLAGIEFPEENFVFDSDTSLFEPLLRDVLSGVDNESEQN